MSETGRFKLPFILPGQAQKELFHNEALAVIDAALHPAVEGPALTVPPEAPVEGQSWIIAAQATGAWSGRDGQIATWTQGGWRIIAPPPGMAAWDKKAAYWIQWRGTDWSGGDVTASSLVISGQQVVGPRQPAVPSPSGGTVIDEQARAAVTAVIATLKSHGLIE
jgi:hypothetical protein